MSRLHISGLILATVLTLAGCTRAGETKTSVSLQIPAYSSIRSLNTNEPTPVLETLFISVQRSGQILLYQKLDYSNQSAPATIDVQIPGVANGDGLLVQALGIYQVAGAAVQIQYGDVSIVVSGNTKAAVNLVSVGALDRKYYLSGRVRLNKNYPSGLLRAFYVPPNGSPSVLVDQSVIASGWFQVYAVDGAGSAFDYVMSDGTVIFKGLNPTLDTSACTPQSLSGACPFQTFGQQDRLRIRKPASYARSSSASLGYTGSVASDYTLGFFGELADNTRYLCYGNDAHEGVPGQYAASEVGTNPLFTTPLDIDFTSASAGSALTTIQYLEGGYGAATYSSGLYSAGVSNCTGSNVSTGASFTLYHPLFSENEAHLGGFDVPWTMVNPLTPGSRFVSVIQTSTSAQVKARLVPGLSYDCTMASSNSSLTLTGTCATGNPKVGMLVSGSGVPVGTKVSAVDINGSGASVVQLDHALVGVGTSPTVTFSEVSSTELWAQLSSDAASEETSGGDCSTLSGLGYDLVATNASSSTTFSFPIPSSLQAGDPKYRFAVCARGLDGSYLGGFVRGNSPSFKNAVRSFAFGWAPSSAVSSSVSTAEALGVQWTKLKRVETNLDQGYTQLTVAANSAPAAGSEVMVLINGTHLAGCEFPAGSIASARVVYRSAGGDSFDIPSGSIIDQLESVSATTLAASASNVSSFCSVQIVQVPHYRNLTLSNGLSSSTPFNYAAGSGGIIPFRVNGKLSIGGAVSADGLGYQGGNATGTPMGAGLSGDVSALSNDLGGSGTAVLSHFGGGGAGIGNGATSFTLSPGGVGLSSASSIGNFSFGGGGGAGNSGGSIQAGARGGGILFVAANRLILNGVASFTANGSATTGFGGAGGGGSINLMLGSVTQSDSTQLLYSSANGGSDDSVNQAGVGGGGAAYLMACNPASDFSFVAPTLTANSGPIGYSSGAVAGFIHVGTPSTDALPWCH